MKKKKWTTKYDKSTITCNVDIAQCEDGTIKYENGTIKCEKKNKGTIECDKSTVTCNVGTMQCEAGIIKCEEKKKEPPNVIKVQSHMMLVLRNVLRNVRLIP